jgi:hypothetical protein
MNAHSAVLTLYDFFSPAPEEFSRRLRTGFQSTAAASSLVTRIGQTLIKLHADEVLRQVGEKVFELLNTPILDVLARAWKQSRTLRESLESTRRSPSETVFLPLVDHSISSEQRPYIEVLQNERPIARLVFPVSVALRLEGMVLKIQDGKIKEILAGNIKIKGTVKFGDFVLLEKDFQPIPLPGSVALDGQS